MVFMARVMSSGVMHIDPGLIFVPINAPVSFLWIAIIAACLETEEKTEYETVPIYINA